MKITYLYWFIPIALFIVQVVFTLNSMSIIRGEEVGNSIRLPFWLAHRTVYNGIGSNVGWDGLLAIIYNFFGFDLFTGKYARLVIDFFSLASLAFLLKKYLGKLAWLPLLTIGLSPTLLFLVTLEAQYGLDLQYLPIILVCLISPISPIRLIGWTLTMVAWMSYPTFVFYLPSLVIYNFYNSYNHYKSYILAALAAFVWPFALALLWVTNKQILLNDPVKETGIFRGGGGHLFQPGAIDKAFSNLSSDLFSSGVSYNFDIAAGEFSYFFPILTLAFVFYNSYKNYNHYKFYISLAFLVIIFSLVVYLATSDPTGMPGIRRATGALAAFYGLFTIVWWQIAKGKLAGKWKVFGMAILSLLLVHHLIVLPQNLQGLSADTKFKEFYKEAYLNKDPNISPHDQYKSALKTLEAGDLYIACSPEQLQTGAPCRYSDIYSVLAGACMWNHLSCHTIYGKDPSTGEFIPLTRDLWDSGYLEQ